MNRRGTPQFVSPIFTCKKPITVSVCIVMGNTYIFLCLKTDNLIGQQLPMIFFFLLSVDLFASSGTLLKGLTSTFNKDDGSTYNEKTWLLGIAFDTSISPTCLKSCCAAKKKLVGFDCLFSHASISGDTDL